MMNLHGLTRSQESLISGKPPKTIAFPNIMGVGWRCESGGSGTKRAWLFVGNALYPGNAPPWLEKETIGYALTS